MTSYEEYCIQLISKGFDNITLDLLLLEVECISLSSLKEQLGYHE